MNIIKDLIFVKIFFIFLLTFFLSVIRSDASRNFLRSDVDHTQIWLIGSKPECNFDCRDTHRRKSCGSNGITFNTECEEERAKCLDPMLKTTHGKCKEATCFQARDHALRKMEGESQNFVYVPNCTADGLYAQRQCNLAFRTCWCVSQDGKLIEGSAVENSEPSCTTGNVRRSTKTCTSNKRASLLTSGRSQIMREYRKATPRAESSGNELLRLALEWEFTHVDKNKDNDANLREVRGFLRKLHARECDTAFLELCDANSDQRISDTEWMSCLFTPFTSPVRKQVQPEPSTTPTTDILIHQHSVKKVRNGRCSSEDRTALIEHIRTWVLSDDPSRSDSDLSMLTTETPDAAKMSLKFLQLDKNKNGFLNQKETNPLRRRFKTFKFKKYFMEICDDNTDGNVSKDEFVNCLSTARGPHCGEERREALKSLRAQEAVVPECEDGDDRYFSQVQCHGTTGYCWCASRETGRPIPGTSIRGEQPDCNRNVTPTPTSAVEIPGCSRPQEFIQSMQNALVKKMTQFQRSASTESANGVQTTFTEEVAVWYFHSLDTNNDEQINRKEAKILKKSLQRKVKPKKCLRKFMRHCDVNNNKKVSQEEFLMCLQISIE